MIYRYSSYQQQFISLFIEEFGGENGTKPLGVARISFGAPSTREDVDKFINFLQRYFLISHETIALALPPSSFSHAQESLSSKPEVYLQNLVRCESNLDLIICHYSDLKLR